jgi:superfamily II DNA or RNA helicase
MPGREVWQPKKDHKTLENLAKIVQTIGYTGRLQDWFDVPDQVDRYVHCQLSKEEEQRIHELPLEFPDPLVLVGKTHQAEQGESKLEAIDDLLAEYPKVLVFARYLDQIKKIEEHFKGKLPVFVLTGQTKDRKKLFEDAEKSHQCLFIAQSQVSAGYELPSFRCVVYASMSYSFVDYTQSRGRVLRANALNKNLYVHLHSGKVDVAIIKCMQGHQDFEEKIYAQGSSVSNKV